MSSESLYGEVERLVEYGLRLNQISRLSKLPINCAQRIATLQGITNLKTGRDRKSVRELWKCPTTLALATAFLSTIVSQLRGRPWSELVLSDVTAAIDSMHLRLPALVEDCDWERIVNTVFLVQDGQINFATCDRCSTHYLVNPASRSAQSCKLCSMEAAETLFMG